VVEKYAKDSGFILEDSHFGNVGVRCCTSAHERETGARMPTEAHPTSKLAGTPISDEETVAKMGHPDLLMG